MECDWISSYGRICFSTRSASKGSRRRPAMLRQRRRCSLPWGNLTAKPPSTKGWNGCERRFVTRVCIRPKCPGETVPHPERHQMDVVVHVKPGPRARVGSIQLKNSTEYRDAEILSRLKMKVGGEITSSRLQRGTDRIRKYLVKKGHLSGRAAVP